MESVKAGGKLRSTRDTFSTNLSGHIEACEKNYQRLMNLLPGLRSGQQEWRFQAGNSPTLCVLVRLTANAPYTSEVEVSQEQGSMVLPGLKLRLCHDASVAEVITFAGHRNWQSRYDYPNPEMYQPDEKLALNRFLEDWLVFCRKHGLIMEDICESVLVKRKSGLHK